MVPQILKNLNGVWNLVLACEKCNRGKFGKFDNLADIKFLKEYKLPVHCVDVNSKFESKIGYKKIDDLKKLIKILNNEL